MKIHNILWNFYVSSHITRPFSYLCGLFFESMRWRSDDHFDWRRWWWGPICVLWNRYQIYWSETKGNKYDSDSKRYSQYRKWKEQEVDFLSKSPSFPSYPLSSVYTALPCSFLICTYTLTEFCLYDKNETPSS